MRNRFRILSLATVVLAFCGTPLAAGIVVEWAELPDPSVQVFEDPYRDLSPEQFDDVVFALRLRSRLQGTGGTAQERQKWQVLLVETEDALATDDIDVDWLLSQREAVTERRKLAGASGNPLFDGRVVTLVGFAIPAPPDPDGHAVAYLVPKLGMCSHMASPPPNQMIRVRLNDDWTPSYLHEQVQLTGTLTIAPSSRQMVVVDGLMPMRATFLLDADSIKTQDTVQGQTYNNKSLVDRLRAAAHRKTGGLTASN
ncbi:DUF3299 domain-containing protein [Ruegeria meonggei]|uniref:DUF3299 domain-containing protein n=1 Tax=Ruegeria meonggei TaxID=1446476 RepID=UPI00366A8E17